MDRWTGVLKVPVYPKSDVYYRIAASLRLSPLSKSLIVPTANAIFFNGDRVEGTGNPVIERLCDIQTIAQILVSKYGASINAWVIETCTFNGPFAIYKEFLPSLNQWGEPQSYKPNGFPASTSVFALLSSFLDERARNDTQEQHHQFAPSASSRLPRTHVFGFSKGGIVLNQLVTELSFMNIKCMEDPAQHDRGRLSETPQNLIIPSSRESFLDSISEIHYVDVGLNSPGAYLTDDVVIRRMADQLMERKIGLQIILHGTPRQWNDKRRAWIREEKDKFHQLLDSEGKKTLGKLQVCDKFYFVEKPPDMQMHFEIIEKLVVSSCRE